MSSSRIDKAAVALIVVALLRVAATLSVLSATTDEPVHVTAGIELLIQHRYTLLPENPPLPRVLFAAPLLAAGVDYDPAGDVKQFVGRTFYSRDEYRTNLVLARAENLLFFALAAACVWRIARRELGPGGGALATLLFTMQPLVLGFAGIANHDMPAVAGTALALFAFVRWIERRTLLRALLFGLAFGLALGFKFTCGPFVVAACLALAIFHRGLFREWRAIPVMLIGAAFALWVSYGFHVAPFLAGVKGMHLIVKDHYDVYALGRWSRDGWWWYFPLALAVKTTIASLVFWWSGGLQPAGNNRRAEARRSTQWLLATIAMLATVLPTRLDLGVRYLLPIYVPFTIAAAAGALAL
ncbi:MAG TPA: glycosyltransferase family 39 protein, partial [Thermoanaerobaculia bacterium]|nr:glycosyltransferase family 39 protein [Thermoanaerobaculia bacterium]